ncbi:hypothetical protein Ate02nite_55360 [Paractinoplanes tereljensis]|uniref:Uncharacterized protein n=1 Tax=Paractinoplanes tereljensis TaxID=571912 RepID=A0A919TUG6_9ACTN|nr:hypothetical protein Ate02nite_55360 [Actinoplanes tereljensis]
MPERVVVVPVLVELGERRIAQPVAPGRVGVAGQHQQADRDRQPVRRQDAQGAPPQVAAGSGPAGAVRDRPGERPEQQEPGEHEEDRDADVEPGDQATPLTGAPAGGDSDVDTGHGGGTQGAERVEGR